MATIKDVASKAGVSVSTVSSVINKNKNVSEELTVRIQKVIKELNYTVNPVARGLKSTRTGVVGVVLPSLTSLFFPFLIKGIETELSKYNYSLTMYDANWDIEREIHYIKQLEKSWVDGILVDSSGLAHKNEKYLELLRNLGGKNKKIHVVSIEASLGSDIGDSVSIDNTKSAYMVVKHLIDLGHEKIACISGVSDFMFTVKRINGYTQALKDAGLPVNKNIIMEGDCSPLSGYMITKELLMNGLDATAIFIANDEMAIGAINALKQAGKRIPEDIAVTGFDNLFISSIVSPTLTTVNVPKFEMGKRAGELLHKRIAGERTGESEEIILSTNLIVRQSTDLRGRSDWELYGW